LTSAREHAVTGFRSPFASGSKSGKSRPTLTVAGMTKTLFDISSFLDWAAGSTAAENVSQAAIAASSIPVVYADQTLTQNVKS
jgi:hypothetical protein